MEAGAVPDLGSGQVTLHYLHRAAAGLGLVYLVALALRARRSGRPEQVPLSVAAAAFTVNVALGAVHVFTEVSSAAVVALHLLFAAVAWAGAVGAAATAWGWARDGSAVTGS